MANNAALYDTQTLMAAGINPASIIPQRRLVINGTEDSGFKQHNKKLLRIIDEQDAVNRYTWYNLPNGLNQKLIERILYYKGQGMFFYMEANDQFYFLPYALDGSIDVYGRYTGVTPLPFNGSASAKGDKEQPWITGLTKTPVYDMVLGELEIEDLLDSCVLIKDYTEQISQTNISRQVLNDPLLDVMADCIPFMRTALLNSTGITGMRVGSADEQSNVTAASMAINAAAQRGEKYVAMVGNVDFQELTAGNVAKSEEFLLAMQSLDNYRLSTYGLDNGGLFQKKSHVLESEQRMNQGMSSLVLQDGLKCRQDACDIINSIWGLGVWCELSETVLGLDKDLDGEVSDNDPASVSYDGGTSNEQYADE